MHLRLRKPFFLIIIYVAEMAGVTFGDEPPQYIRLLLIAQRLTG